MISLSGRNRCWCWWGKTVAEKGAKKTLSVIGCVLVWLAAALFTFLEGICLYLWITGTVYVMKWGAEENPYAAEDAWAAGVFASMLAIPFVLTLILSIRSTIKLRKQGKKREHPISDQR